MSSGRASGPLRSFLGALARFAPRKTVAATVLLVLQGLTEGVGLILLVPFLLLVGDPDGADTAARASNGVAGFIGKAFASLGLPLSLPGVLVAFVLLIVLRSLLLARSGILLARIQLGFVNHLRARIFGALGRAGWRTLVRKRLADTVHAMAQDVSRVSGGTREALDLLATLVLACAYAFAALRISPTTTLVAAGAGLLLELVRWPLVRRARKLGEAMTSIQREAFRLVSEFVQGLKPIKASGLEGAHHETYVSAIDEIESRRLEHARAALRAHVIHQVLLALALAALIYVAAVHIGIGTAELLVIVFVFARLMPLLSKLHQGYTNMVEALPAYDSALAICEELEAAAEARPTAALVEGLAFARELRLENVSVRYEPERSALDAVTLTLRANRTLAVLGPSGAGKTTLVDVIMGLLEPDEGRVTVDGVPLEGARRLAWRRSVAYVPQETFLLHDTIEANLRWMRPEATEGELWQALADASAEDFVRALPLGLQTVVGDRGARLSGGERQRIALARALLTEPRLLLLDEATSQLDEANEERILQALEHQRGKRTVVLIAHRPTLVALADDVVHLERGRVVEPEDSLTDT